MSEAPAQEAAQAPLRPAGVPAGASWLAEAEQWELLPTGDGGVRDGEHLVWRSDGTLFMRGRMEGGKRTGPVAWFHPNGQVAREGRCVAGELDGVVNAYSSDAPTPEALRGCCVPAGAWQMRSIYSGGRLMRESFLDREGRVLLSDGSFEPARPATVPPEATYEEYAARWAAGTIDPESGYARGTWRWWSGDDGRVVEEIDYGEQGKKIAVRAYATDGSLRDETHLDPDEKAHGPCLRRFVDGNDSPYADPRVRGERGAFHHGQACGPWSLLDAGGAVVRTTPRGIAVDDEALVRRPVFADSGRAAGQWHDLATALRGEGRSAEAVCAAARACAAAGDASLLRAFLAEATAPATPAASARMLGGDQGNGLERAGPVVAALLAGAEPAAAFRMLASVVTGQSPAARDFVQASLLLDPTQTSAYLTRALVRIEIGDPDGAREDVARIGQETRETAAFLDNYLRLLFPEFSFWPAREIPYSTMEGLPPAPGQPLPAVLHTIRVYATRLLGLHDVIRARVGGTPPWLPPDPRPLLLPDGPLELRQYKASIEDEGDDGRPEVTEVAIDERLEVGTVAMTGLLRLVRSQWTALTWLCWCAGLDRVALPQSLSPPANFAQAAGMVITRAWRAQDAVVTNGLRAMTAGVAGFSWEGMDIDGISRPFAEMAADEYGEARAVFLWLVSPENISPFQSDIRGL